MLTAIANKFRSPTVASLLGDFNKTIRSLRQLADDKMADASVKTARIAELEREVEAAEGEALEASAIADKIEALIDPDAPDLL